MDMYGLKGKKRNYIGVKTGILYFRIVVIQNFLSFCF